MTPLPEGWGLRNGNAVFSGPSRMEVLAEDGYLYVSELDSDPLSAPLAVVLAILPEEEMAEALRRRGYAVEKTNEGGPAPLELTGEELEWAHVPATGMKDPHLKFGPFGGGEGVLSLHWKDDQGRRVTQFFATIDGRAGRPGWGAKFAAALVEALNENREAWTARLLALEEEAPDA